MVAPVKVNELAQEVTVSKAKSSEVDFGRLRQRHRSFAGIGDEDRPVIVWIEGAAETVREQLLQSQRETQCKGLSEDGVQEMKAIGVSEVRRKTASVVRSQNVASQMGQHAAGANFDPQIWKALRRAFHRFGVAHGPANVIAQQGNEVSFRRKSLAGRG